MTRIDCPRRRKDEPSGYVDWHQWAEKMARTHDQKQCPKCGLFHVWSRRKAEGDAK